MRWVALLLTHGRPDFSAAERREPRTDLVADLGSEGILTVATISRRNRTPCRQRGDSVPAPRGDEPEWIQR
jgi:hypothetical protein